MIKKNKKDLSDRGLQWCALGCRSLETDEIRLGMFNYGQSQNSFIEKKISLHQQKNIVENTKSER